MEGLKVRCQTCGSVLYETTKYYTCHKPLTGDMLRLLPLYRDWPTYDGSLATKGTPRFLMFCSQCAGYISITGKLKFADFRDEKVTEVSQERSDMMWWDSPVERGEFISNLHIVDMAEAIDNLIIPNAEDSSLSDVLQKMDPDIMAPEDMMEKIEKQAKISRKKKMK